MRVVSLLLVALFGFALISARHISSAVEDSDNDALANAEQALDQEEDQPAELEEEEVEAKINKVVADAESMGHALEEADMDETVKAEAMEDVDKIAADAEEISSATPARASKLKLAIKKRMEALNLLIHSQEEEEEAPATRVAKDITQVKAALKSADLPAADKAHATRLLNSMTTTAKKIASHSTPALKQQLHRQLEELKTIMSDNDNEQQEAESRGLEEEEEAVTRVKSDVAAIRKQIKAESIPSAVKKSALANLDSILHDAEEIPSAEASRKHNLQKAMKLRVAALREQLQ